MANVFVGVGVDVSKAELVCRILDEKGQELGQETFCNGSAGFRKFKKFLLSLDPEGRFFVSMEATGVYFRNFARFIFHSNDRGLHKTERERERDDHDESRVLKMDGAFPGSHARGRDD